MAIDIFAKEQEIFENAKLRVNAVRDGADFNFEEYESLVTEYGKVLKQLRLSTRVSDWTTIELFEDNIDLSDKVHLDSLTGLYNRRFMEDSLKRIIKSLSRTRGKLGILMIDIDFFKKYNDTYGHASGDMCLKTVAETLEKSLSRPDDFVARYGGEEFIAVLPDTGEEGARFVAEKILKDVQCLNIPHANSKISDYVTVSIGAVTGKVERRQLYEDYIKCADEALYLSKNDGRNKYTFLDFDADGGRGCDYQQSWF